MEINEIISPEYAEAFGLEATPEDVQDGAAGEGGTENQPQEPGAAAESGAGTGDVEQEPETQEGGTEPPVRREMSPEERHRQAEARRAREEQERQAAEQTRRDQIFAEMFAGQVSPYTGKPITTEAEYRAYQAEKERRAGEEQLRRAGIEQGTIQDIVRREMAPMQENLQRMQMKAMQERARQVQEAANREIEAQLKLVAAVDPSVQTLEDIVAKPTGKAFQAYVDKGLTIEEAFQLANRKEIEARKLTAAQAAARNGVAGKSHLNPVTGGSGQEPVEVPAEMRDAYREMMPGATDAEIRTAYAKFLKDTKKG